MQALYPFLAEIIVPLISKWYMLKKLLSTKWKIFPPIPLKQYNMLTLLFVH